MTRPCSWENTYTETAKLPEDDRPFCLTSNAILARLASGELNVKRLVLEELAARGLDINGEWIGFDAAEKLHLRRGRKAA